MNTAMAKYHRAFKEGDTAEINHNGYNNFPLGTSCIIQFCGIIREGKPSYHVIFNNGADITVSENELRPPKEKIH